MRTQMTTEDGNVVQGALEQLELITWLAGLAAAQFQELVFVGSGSGFNLGMHFVDQAIHYWPDVRLKAFKSGSFMKDGAAPPTSRSLLVFISASGNTEDTVQAVSRVPEDVTSIIAFSPKGTALATACPVCVPLVTGPKSLLVRFCLIQAFVAAFAGKKAGWEHVPELLRNIRKLPDAVDRVMMEWLPRHKHHAEILAPENHLEFMGDTDMTWLMKILGEGVLREYHGTTVGFSTFVDFGHGVEKLISRPNPPRFLVFEPTAAGANDQSLIIKALGERATTFGKLGDELHFSPEVADMLAPYLAYFTARRLKDCIDVVRARTTCEIGET